MKRLIKNGTLVNPKNNQVGQYDIRIEDERIIEVGVNLSDHGDDEVIDASGLHIAPGFIDLHVHLREPGFPEKETIYTGTRACAKGGYTTVVCMPNTNPALDTASVIEKLFDLCKRDSVITVVPTGAITMGIRGETLTDHEQLFKAGACALSDDGRTTMNADYMRRAFEAANLAGKLVMTHSEDHDITSKIQDKIYPTEAESNIVKRDIDICASENGKLHISHVSTLEAIESIRSAKAKGINVTCEAAPHHFALSDTMVDMKDTMSKVNPPIRSEKDKDAIIEAMIDGTIDVIATDHAPHDHNSKLLSYEAASFGISGIETAFSVSYTTLVKSGFITLLKLIALLSYRPAQIGKFENVGSVEVGYFADLVLLDLKTEQIIDSTTFLSKGKNTPFNGLLTYGAVHMTLHHGDIVYKR